MINSALFAWVYRAAALRQIIPSRLEMDRLGRIKSQPSLSVRPSPGGQPIVRESAGPQPLAPRPTRNMDFSLPSTNRAVENAVEDRVNGPVHSVLVSVIIPAYEASDYIAQTLNSVFAQTFTNLEVLLVNDGSPDTDRLERVLRPYLGQIRYLKQENRGPSAARNTAIKQAKGKYLAFLDSDDFWLPHHLACQVELLERNPKLKLVYANSILIVDGSPIGRAFDISAPQSGPVTFEGLIRETCTVNTSSTVASRQAVLEAGAFDETMNHCEDLDLWLRMCYRGADMDYRRNPQVCHRIRNGLAANRELMKQAHIAVYRKILSILPVAPGRRAMIQDCIGQIEAGLHVERAKRLLLQKQYAEALSAAREANTILDSWKLRMAMTGMRHVPALFRQSYRAYQRILEARQHRRHMRFSAKERIDLELPVLIGCQPDIAHVGTTNQG